MSLIEIQKTVARSSSQPGTAARKRCSEVTFLYLKSLYYCQSILILNRTAAISLTEHLGGVAYVGDGA